MVFEASEDFRERQQLLAGRVYEGKVVQAPASVSQGLVVRMLDGQLAYGPMAWPARGTTLPAVGDNVLFTESDQGQYWCLVWWPYGEID